MEGEVRVRVRVRGRGRVRVRVMSERVPAPWREIEGRSREIETRLILSECRLDCMGGDSI